MRDVTDIERELLSAVIREDAADDVDLEPGDFGLAQHRALWAAIRRCRADGVWPSDPALLEARCPEWKACGGLDYWSGLVGAAGLRDMLPRYASEIRAAALTRRLKGALADLGGSALEADDLLEECMRRLGAAGERRTEAGRTMTDWMADAVRDLGRRMEEKQAGGTGVRGLDTGLVDLDGLLCGIMPGVLTVVGARPSIGKSALARGIAEWVAASGRGTHYFSHEDSGDMVATRSLSAASSVPVHRLLGCDYDRRDYAAMIEASTSADFGRWWLDDAAGLSSDQIALRVRRRKRQLGTVLVVVDYVQLMREPGARTMLEMVGRASSGLVRLARDERVAVILLSQLSREAAKEGRPQLHHLRESGTLEQDAYAVLLLDRDRDKAPERLTVEVAKNKNGPTGRVVLFFDGPLTAVRSLSSRDAA